MTQVVGAITSLFQKPKSQGPTAAEKAAQANREKAAFDDAAEADRLAALAANQGSRRRALSYQDQRKGTLG